MAPELTHWKNISFKKALVNVLVTGLLLLLLLCFLFPLYLITINSFKSEAEYFEHGPLVLPRQPSLEYLTFVWQEVKFGQKLLNSLKISLIAALATMMVALCNGFALGIGRIKGSRIFLILFMLAMTIPPIALYYPLYWMFRVTKIYNTHLSVILISIALNMSFGTYLLTAVFRTFPTSFIEAAQMDGCNKWYILGNIVVPLNMPIISVLFVYTFIGTWNDFFTQLIFIISNDKMTVPITIILRDTQFTEDITYKCAIALLSTLPCLIFFFIFQRQLTRGITASGIKG